MSEQLTFCYIKATFVFDKISTAEHPYFWIVIDETILQ